MLKHNGVFSGILVHADAFALAKDTLPLRFRGADSIRLARSSGGSTPIIRVDHDRSSTHCYQSLCKVKRAASSMLVTERNCMDLTASFQPPGQVLSIVYCFAGGCVIQPLMT